MAGLSQNRDAINHALTIPSSTGLSADSLRRFAMVTRILVSIALLAACIPAYAADTSPFFGSASHEPLQIAIDPNTGLPLVAKADVEEQQPQPVVATRQ
jgi:hypothetical protein